MFPREYICTNARLLCPVNISSVTIITPWLYTQSSHNNKEKLSRNAQGCTISLKYKVLSWSVPV